MRDLNLTPCTISKTVHLHQYSSFIAHVLCFVTWHLDICSSRVAFIQLLNSVSAVLAYILCFMEYPLTKVHVINQMLQKTLPHSIFKTDGLKNICAGFHLTNIFVFKFTIMCCFCFGITSVTIQLTVIHLWKWWRPVHGGDQYHFFCILVIFCDLFILPILLR